MSANGIATEVEVNLNEISAQTTAVAEELLDAAKLDEGDILVVGCSSSEVAKHGIGTYSSKEIGETIFSALKAACDKRKVYLATQCCEHLNRAIIMEKKCAKEHGYAIVNVVPQLKAGGSFSTAAYTGFEQAVAVEYVQAQAGIDIGDTLIGMHLQPVAVPYRTKQETIGYAHVVTARTRPKYIGGERAHYNDNWK